MNLQVWCWGGFWSLGPDPGLSACKHASSLHPHTTVGHILISSIDLQLYATIGLHPFTKSCRCERKKGHLDISEIMQIIILKISSNSVLTKLTCSKQCMWASCQESSPLTVVWVACSTEKNFCLDNFFGVFFWGHNEIKGLKMNNDDRFSLFWFRKKWFWRFKVLRDCYLFN